MPRSTWKVPAWLKELACRFGIQLVLEFIRPWFPWQL